MRRIFDQLGRLLRPATKAEMLEEHSAPEVGTVRQIRSGHPADGLMPQKLAAILRAAEDGDASAYFDLAEQMEEKDLHYAAVLGVRKRAIRGLDLIVEPGDDSARAIEAADMLRDTLAGPEARESLIDMLDALGKGVSVCEIIWNTQGRQWWVEGLEYRPPRFFEFDSVNGCHLKLRGASGGTPLAPDKYVVHIATAKSGLPIRGGLARMAAWGVMFKNFSVKDWAIFLEAYGHPLRLGKYDPDYADEANKRTLLKAARSIGVDMAAIIPNNMDLEVIATNSRTTDSYERKVRWWDEQLSKGVLGQVATTDAIAGGHAVGKIHETVREDIRDADADQLAITLMRDLGRPLTHHNFGPDVAPPKLRFQAPERVDPDQLLKLMQIAGPGGFRIAEADVYRAFSLRQPDKEDKVMALKLEQQTAARDHDHQHFDPVTQMIDELIESGGMHRVMEADYGDFLNRIKAATSYADILALIDQAEALPPGAAGRELLSRAMFNARLGGDLGA